MNGKDDGVNYNDGIEDIEGPKKDTDVQIERGVGAYDRDVDEDSYSRNVGDVLDKQGREVDSDDDADDNDVKQDRQLDDDDDDDDGKQGRELDDDDVGAYKAGDNDSDEDGRDMWAKDEGDGPKLDLNDDSELPSKDGQGSDVFRSTVLSF